MRLILHRVFYAQKEKSDENYYAALEGRIMATTGFWPVRSSLGAVIAYADNPDKTTNPKYLDDDLAQVLRYAENDDKTDQRLFVTGIHCTAEHALEDMTAVQRRFGLKGQIVAYHGYQSFKTGEVQNHDSAKPPEGWQGVLTHGQLMLVFYAKSDFHLLPKT